MKPKKPHNDTIKSADLALFQMPATASVDIQLAALGALLPGLVRAPTRETMAAFVALLITLKQAELPTAQLSIIQLLEAVITLSAKLPAHKNKTTEGLINNLYEYLIADQKSVDCLPAAISQCTDWIQQISVLMPVMPTINDQNEDTQFTYTAKELYLELAELRLHISNECAQLRHEMHHQR